jgi:anti-sigma factor RsiW
MNCEEAKNLLDSYADGELDLVNHLQVEQHLNQCAGCKRIYENRMSLKSALADESLYFNANDELRRRIRTSLQGSEPVPITQKIRKWGWMPVLATAAVLVIAIFTTVNLLQPSVSNDDLASEMVSSHIRSMMVNHLTDVPSTDQHTVKPWFDGKLDFSPPVVNLEQQGFPLVGGRLDYVGGRPVAALVYQRRQHIINVFVFPGNSDSGTKVQVMQGYNVIHWTKSSMIFWAVSDLNAAELQEFVTLLQSQ